MFWFCSQPTMLNRAINVAGCGVPDLEGAVVNVAPTDPANFVKLVTDHPDVTIVPTNMISPSRGDVILIPDEALELNAFLVG